MFDKRRYEDDARYLSSHVVTHWDNYDFAEKSEDAEKRVPTISFDGVSNIEIKARPAEYVKGFGYEKFIRRYEVTYKDGHFLFNIIVNVHFDCVKEYMLNVSLITSDDSIHLISEVL